MTEQHPITPPPELVQQWSGAALGAKDWLGGYDLELIATQAASWGADQELEACCHLLWLQGFDVADDLRAARRPKPLSLKEQALAVIENSAICDHLSPEHQSILRRALEQLDD